jgi:predicted transcriptional regulator
MTAGGMTSSQLAAEFGVTRHAVNKVLRATYGPAEGARRLLSDEQVAEVRAHFAAVAARRAARAPRTCVVEGCARPGIGQRGWCKSHRERWRRAGTFEAGRPGANQLAKTHCPQGHEYSPENTLVFPSEPRHRRCFTCRYGRPPEPGDSTPAAPTG